MNYEQKTFHRNKLKRNLFTCINIKYLILSLFIHASRMTNGKPLFKLCLDLNKKKHCNQITFFHIITGLKLRFFTITQ